MKIKLSKKIITKILSIVYLALLLSACGDKSNLLFDEILTQNIAFKGGEEGRGGATAGNLGGDCKMTLTDNSEGDKIVIVRYNLANPYTRESDDAVESYIVTDLKRKSKKIDGFKFTNKDMGTDIYIQGKIKGLNASVNGGTISECSATGEIFFMLDSLDYRFKYIMLAESNANWQYTGSEKLELDQYILLKEIYLNKKLSENEKEILISQSNALIYDQSSALFYDQSSGLFQFNNSLNKEMSTLDNYTEKYCTCLEKVAELMYENRDYDEVMESYAIDGYDQLSESEKWKQRAKGIILYNLSPSECSSFGDPDFYDVLFSEEVLNLCGSPKGLDAKAKASVDFKQTSGYSF